MKAASELSRSELNDLRAQYEEQLRGPMWRQQLVITRTMDYFKGIPRTEQTPELGALEEIFSEVGGKQLWGVMLEDLQLMEGEFMTPELQNEVWFGIQYLFYTHAYRLELYCPLAQKLAARYGFELPIDTDTIFYPNKTPLDYTPQ